MKKTILVIFCLSMWSMTFALPISLRSGVNYGKFYDPGNSGGKVFQFETGVRSGKHLLLSTGILLEYYKYDDFPNYFGIPEYRIVSEDMHQYAYGGSITLGIGKNMGPHMIYRFKRVRTYRISIIEDFCSSPGYYWTEAEFKEEPAYDVVFGFHGKIPRTKLYLVGEWTAWSRIWNVERNMITFGLGYEIGLGNIRKGIVR